jgi:Uma2 family endonuclease
MFKTVADAPTCSRTIEQAVLDQAVLDLLDQPQPVKDQRIIQPERSWAQFKLIQQGFENAPGVRLFYHNGTVEILMPGREHELFSAVIALLLSIFFIENDIEFEPTGSMDQEKAGEAFVQADQSYCIGSSKPIPDLSIEVVVTSGGPNKLARYQILGRSRSLVLARRCLPPLSSAARGLSTH